MEFMHGVYGPDFDKADLVSFDFRDVNVLFRLPEHDEKECSRFLAASDCKHIASDKWETDGAGIQTYTIVENSWLYKYFHKQLNVERDIFLVHLAMVLVAIPPSEQDVELSLGNASFAKMVLDAMHKTVMDISRQFSSDMSLEENIKAWQAPATVDDLGVITRDPLNWLVTTFGDIGSGTPDTYTFIPLNARYFLLIIFKSSKLQYSGITDVFTDKDIEHVEGQIIREFLDHVRIEYAPEILQKIKKQN